MNLQKLLKFHQNKIDTWLMSDEENEIHIAAVKYLKELIELLREIM